MNFPCISCGLCCQSLNLATIDDYKYLDQGDGTCRHLNLDSKLCSIYHERPLICRVGYAYAGDEKSLAEYFDLNTHMCIKLMLKNRRLDLIDEMNTLLNSLGKPSVFVNHIDKK